MVAGRAVKTFYAAESIVYITSGTKRGAWPFTRRDHAWQTGIDHVNACTKPIVAVTVAAPVAVSVDWAKAMAAADNIPVWPKRLNQPDVP
jgi:hypothetical protein